MNNAKRSQEICNKALYTKRSHLNDSQSSITHVGSPVNPMTAKALASKLLSKPSVQTTFNSIKNTAGDSASPVVIQPLSISMKHSSESDGAQSMKQNKQIFETGTSDKVALELIGARNLPHQSPSNRHGVHGNDVNKLVWAEVHFLSHFTIIRSKLTDISCLFRRLWTQRKLIDVICVQRRSIR